MGCDNKTVTVSADDVMTLSEVAEEFKRHFDLAKCEAIDDKAVISFETKGGQKGYVGLSGWAYERDDTLSEDERFSEGDPSLDEFSVDWNEVLGFNNVVWADDEDGNSVLVHD